MPAADTPTLATLTDGMKTRGFTVRALYLDAGRQPVGARFVHDATGFTMDYLAIESAPQGFLWVNSLPTSNMGEPHTQEHLLLGKGDRGRRLGGVEAMALGESSAFTAQWRTAYHFHTIAGAEAYWTVFENQLDALLNPDYTDEEIRREVAHFGPSVDPTGALRLEEKGTVYQEMVRTYEQPSVGAWRRALQLVWGDAHPLALDSGGIPDDIRRMSADDIRRFHQQNYHLANMGLIAAYPRSMALGTVLERTDALLRKLAGRAGKVRSVADAGPASPAPAGTIATVEFPHQDAGSPGSLMLVWPVARQLEVADKALLELLLSSVAGDESTNLYKLFIDSKSKTIDFGATGVWAWVSPDPGTPVFLGLSQVAAAHLDEAGAKRLRAAVQGELRRIAALPADAPELLALRERMNSRLIQTRRALAKSLNTPPGFGFRGTGAWWMELVLELERVPGFEKSLVYGPQLDAVEQLLAAPGNPWSERLAAWKLLDEPYVIVARPSPAERTRLDGERDARLAAETARLKAAYGAADEPAALRQFAADYDATTRTLEDAARTTALPPLVDALPMTLDDGLDFREQTIAGVPAVISSFPGTTAGTVGLALRLDGTPAELQAWTGMLPGLLTEVGVIIDGQPVSSEEAAERRRREILGLYAWIDSDSRTGRVELMIEARGLDTDETRRALAWMAWVLAAPDLRAENLPRLRDLVDQSAIGLRSIMQGAEEGWVMDARDGYLRQTWPVYAHSSSALTSAHDAHRLRWRLRGDPADAATVEAAGYLDGLAAASRTMKRAALVELAAALATPPAKPGKALAKWLPPAKLSAAAREHVREAGRDLAVLLADLPDDSLAADWSYLCKQMAADLRVGAPATLAELAQLRALVVRRGSARLYVVGSPELAKAITPGLEALVGVLGEGAAPARVADGPRFIDGRAGARAGRAGTPVYVGLVNPATQGGAFLHAAPAASLLDTGDDALLDYLASNLYTGHGPHSLFIKTWGAGLAYSNGARVQVRQGLLSYYAERCPELPQTMRFVIDTLEKAAPDESLIGYALAQAFSSRVAQDYEGRGRAMAADLADGITPAAVRRFREGLLALRDRKGLAGELAARFRGVYARVLPGMGKAWKPAAGAVYLVIGPLKQLDAWQEYLKKTVAADAELWRLYPRDYWIPAAVK